MSEPDIAFLIVAVLLAGVQLAIWAGLMWTWRQNKKVRQHIDAALQQIRSIQLQRISQRARGSDE